MNTLVLFSERLQRLFQPGPRGVVGLVDDLLELCREQPLHLEWQRDRCCVYPMGTESPEPIQIPMQKSVFRALLARFSSLCNEHKPDSVSPYSGEGELAVTTVPAVFHVEFRNTPAEQRIKVNCLGDNEDALLRQKRGLSPTLNKTEVPERCAVTTTPSTGRVAS
jgi:hypothetical protein